MKISSPFFTLTRPFPRLAVLMVLLTVIASLMEGITLSLVIPLLQRLVDGNNASSLAEGNFLIQRIFNYFNQFTPKNQLGIIIAILLILVIIKGVVRFWADYSLRNLMLKVGYNLRLTCIDYFLNLGLSYYNRVQGGNLLSFVNEQTQRCEQLTLYSGSVFSESLVIFSYLILLLSISWKLTLFSIFLLMIVAVCLKAIIANVRTSGKIVSDTIEEFSSNVYELISGIRVIKSYTAELKESEKLKQILQKRYYAERRSWAGQVAVQPISDTCGIIVLIILVILGTRIIDQGLILSLLLTFLLVLLRMFPRINHLNRLRVSLSSFGESYQSIQYFFQYDKPDVKNGSQIFNGLQEIICFESVTFTHSDSLQPTLENINFNIPRGSITAIVGESGSGKSTLSDLLLRFYDPQFGQITIDGIDLQEFNLSSWRQKIAVVSQDNFLFNCSVRENIRYGNPTSTEIEILEAARLAYAEDFISELPKGFDTVLGDRGVKLSGGQRQRLAIARAIIRNPEILILDEATSALDSSSEKLVQQAIDVISQNRTVLIIAHRLSTIRNADQIIVLKKGEVIEKGTHEHLLKNHSYYYGLCHDQISKLEL